MPTNSTEYVLSIDYGDKRVGLALASLESRLPSPLTTIINDANLLNTIGQIIEKENVVAIVTGYTRGLDGQSTPQTQVIEEFVVKLKESFKLQIETQDEALTSQKAEDELSKRGKPYKREDVDALAATYILDDWFNDHKKYNEIIE